MWHLIFVLVPLAGGIVAQFYFKWVPDVETQKRQVKRIGGWVIDIGGCTFYLGDLYWFTRELGAAPITGKEAALIALICGCLAFFLSFIVVRRLIIPYVSLGDSLNRSIVDIQKSTLSVLQEDAKLTKNVLQAMAILAANSKLDAESRLELNEHLQSAEESVNIISGDQ